MFQNDPHLLITDLPGYSPDISRLLSMMNYARFTTLQEVKDLTMEQLDFVAEEGGGFDRRIAAACCGRGICIPGQHVRKTRIKPG